MNPPSDENAPFNQSIYRRRSREARSARRPKRTNVSAIDVLSAEPQLPGIGTMARTRRLILAALRVWELKRGIRDS